VRPKAEREVGVAPDVLAELARKIKEELDRTARISR
jgi:hypothetical protein